MKKSSSTPLFIFYLLVLVGLGVLVVFMRSDVLQKKETETPAPLIVVAPKKSEKNGKVEITFEKTAFKKEEAVRFFLKNGTDKAMYVTPQEAQVSPEFFVINEHNDRIPTPHCPACTVIDPPLTKIESGASLIYIWNQETQQGKLETGSYNIEIEYWGAVTERESHTIQSSKITVVE